MSTDELLEEIEARGFEVYLKDGDLVMRGDLELATSQLLRVIKHHRQEILRRVTPRPPREWIWRYGQTYTEDPQDRQYGNPDFHAVGAWFWRYQGEPEWRPVPGRGGMHMIQIGLSQGRLYP